MRSYALLDGGSTRHVVSGQLCERLGIVGEEIKMSVTTLDRTTESVRQVADVRVEGTNGVSFTLGGAIFGNIIAAEGDAPPSDADIAHLPHLHDISFPQFPRVSGDEISDGSGAKIGVIIGAEHAEMWMMGERRVGPKGTPIGVETDIGWGLLGPKSIDDSSACCFCASFHPCQNDLSKELEMAFAGRFEPVEEEAVAYSVEDRYALKQMEETIRWDPAVGRYRVGLPWKLGREATAAEINGLDSDQMAFDRLRRLGRKMLKDPERMRITFETMAKFDEKGRVKIVEPADNATWPRDRPKWTIPIHVADKPGKPGQVRVCHDCKARVGRVCLNDFLLDGPPLACDIRGVIMRFRDGGEVAVAADVKDFFHEVYVDERDAAAYRYWWFHDDTMQEVEMKEFLGHVFGAKSSGCVATFTLRYHVDTNVDKYGVEVKEAVARNFYVDDLCKSLRDVATAKAFREKSTAALKEGGFDLCKWRSSHPEVLLGDEAPVGAAQSDFLLPESGLGSEKILGMRYNFVSDEFFFQTDPIKFMLNVTNKRGMLKVIASVFDPLNAWSPWTIVARLMFQKAVQAVKGWDDADRLPQPLLNDFRAWQESGVELERLRIPRWTATRETQDGDSELHVFSDASAEAYGVVAYRRTVSRDGGIHVAFVTSRAHVVPVKVVAAGHHESIPRLELQAARLAAETRAAIERH